MTAEKSKTGLKMKYFILKPKGNNAYAKASRAAMKAYADSIQKENFLLALDLEKWLQKLSMGKTHPKICGCGYCDN
jgi:hypothetical protein